MYIFQLGYVQWWGLLAELRCLGASRCWRADEWNKLTVLTVNQPIQVTDKLLDPGQYVFKLLDSSSDRPIVQIFNADQT
jgi:hypothetical protein